MKDDPQPLIAAIRSALPETLLRDRHRLDRRLRSLAGRGDEETVRTLWSEVRASAAQVAARRAGLPQPRFPEELPVSARREEIAAAIRDHQVVVVAGETGSGKTTQLPKICLALGRGVHGLIGHTQPRRIAARSVAVRVAEELGSPLGQAVGYKVRFTDRGSPDSFVKVMTDGILLAEIQNDRYLNQYDTLIIDEAHERSLNIDFLLGYLKRLLPRRPELKLIITSATIDPARFAHFFGDAPVVEVSGRTYPVEVHYRPLRGEDEEQQERDRQQAVLEAVDEAARHGPGDVLVFLAGEREIRDTAEALRKHHPPHTEILPLFARLSAAEQQRVFAPHSGRRIVLATNVAETSLTVPGIRYVVDPGTARISRYSARSKVQGLPIEPISQASANQRKGRCGRVSAGICYRLYSEEEFLARPPFTDPEILRTHLAAVILRMAALDLGEVERFPFLDAPEERAVRDGYRLLSELGALDGQQRLTPLGRQLAKLPVDPRVGRMVLAGADHQCLDELLIIASALSIQDPRDRPLDHQQAADEAHKPFQHPDSDFLTFVSLWRFWQEQKAHLSQNKLRQRCREQFLSFVRMREWEEIHTQLYTLVRELGLRPNQLPAEYEPVHKALLAGLLDNVGMRLDGEGEAGEGRRRPLTAYLGARNTRLHLFPGSSQAGKKPRWMVAAEIVETQRVYARVVARVEPEWVEAVGAHLVKRTTFDPHWEKRAAKVMAYERVSLYGLVLQAKRPIHYGPLAPEEARTIFIREALVRGDLQTRAAFFRHNRELIESVEALESKSRRRDILVEEETLFEFYDRHLPAGIHSGAQFDKWLRQAERRQPRLLHLTREDLMRHGAAGVTAESFPEQIRAGALTLALEYHFEPGHDADGVTVTVPVAALNQLTPEPFEWLVPGLLRERVVALMKGLPKALRRNFVPVPDFADAALERLEPGQGSLTAMLSAALRQMTGVRVSDGDWNEAELPAHLRMNFRVVEPESGKVLAEGRDLGRLQEELGAAARRSFRAAPVQGVERDALVDWAFGTLPEQVALGNGGLCGYPALVDGGATVALRVLDTRERADAVGRAGLVRLFLLRLGPAARRVAKGLPVTRAMAMQYALAAQQPAPLLSLGPAGDESGPVGEARLRDDLLWAAAATVFVDELPWPRTREEFEARLEAGQPALVETANRVAREAQRTLERYHRLLGRLKGLEGPTDAAAHKDVTEQLGRLLYRGALGATPWSAQRHLPRYLQALEQRLEKRAQNRRRDDEQQALVRPLWERFWSGADAAHQGVPQWHAFRWALEELRVSLFAQGLKTAYPVSVKRLETQWQALVEAERGGKLRTPVGT